MYPSESGWMEKWNILIAEYRWTSKQYRMHPTWNFTSTYWNKRLHVHLTTMFHLTFPPFSFAFVSRQPPHQRSGVLDDQTRLKSPYTFASCRYFMETAYNHRGPVPTQESFSVLSGELKQSCRVWRNQASENPLKHRGSAPYLSWKWMAAVSESVINLIFCNWDKIVFADAGEITKVAVSVLTKLTPLR